MSATPLPPITDNVDESRFEVSVDGQTAILTYKLRRDRLILVHTGVPDELGGRGIAGALIEAAVTRAEADGLTVVPVCPFAASWLREHPDQAGRVNIHWRSEQPAD